MTMTMMMVLVMRTLGNPIKAHQVGGPGLVERKRPFKAPRSRFQGLAADGLGPWDTPGGPSEGKFSRCLWGGKGFLKVSFERLQL